MQKRLQNILQAEIDPAFAKRAMFIFTAIEKAKPKRVLDVGCGRGFYLQALTSFSFISQIHGIDINKDYLRVAKEHGTDKRIKIQQGSIYELPYPDSYFDMIICSEVMEHLDDEKKGLQELRRILKKDGILLVTVPNYNFPFLWDPINFSLMKLFNTHVNKDIWWLAGIWADHMRLYKKDKLIQLVQKCGLRVTKTENFLAYCWPFSHMLLYGIGKNIVERLGFRSFDRFSFQEKKFSSFVARLMKFPSRFENNEKNSRYMGIGISAKK